MRDYQTISLKIFSYLLNLNICWGDLKLRFILYIFSLFWHSVNWHRLVTKSGLAPNNSIIKSGTPLSTTMFSGCSLFPLASSSPFISKFLFYAVLLDKFKMAELLNVVNFQQTLYLLVFVIFFEIDKIHQYCNF